MSDDPQDWALVAQLQAGQDRAFDLLLERYKRPVFSFIFRMIGDAAEAEDAAQDVFVRVHHSICAARVRPTGGKFSTWLFQVARNAALDRLRYRRRRPTEALGAAPEAVTHETAVSELFARETGAQIAAAVALLPESQRTVLVLAEYEGLSYAEIAAILGCSAKSVETRLYRARQFLRERLKDLLG